MSGKHYKNIDNMLCITQYDTSEYYDRKRNQLKVKRQKQRPTKCEFEKNMKWRKCYGGR